LLWLDAGNLLIGNLERIKQLVAYNGFYSPYSAGTIGDWTHKLTLEILNFPHQRLTKPNCNGAIVGLNLENSIILKLISDWNSCAMNKSCIAPIGSSRLNHRQDQAVLSVLTELINLNKRGRYRNLNEKLNILIHQDKD
jgi:hypothetical protein